MKQSLPITVRFMHQIVLVVDQLLIHLSLREVCSAVRTTTFINHDLFFNALLLASNVTSYLPFVLLGVRYNAPNNISLAKVDDGASSAIQIPIDFPFGSSTQETMFVSCWQCIHSN